MRALFLAALLALAAPALAADAPPSAGNLTIDLRCQPLAAWHAAPRSVCSTGSTCSIATCSPF